MADISNFGRALGLYSFAMVHEDRGLALASREVQKNPEVATKLKSEMKSRLGIDDSATMLQWMIAIAKDAETTNPKLISEAAAIVSDREAAELKKPNK